MEEKTNAANAGMPSVSEAMEKIMAHPELISMVASVLGAPTASGKEGDSVEDSKEQRSSAAMETETPAEPSESVGIAASASENGAADWMATFAPLLSALGAGKGGRGKSADDPRSCLLRALKPYVSQGRREAIDYMIRLSQISDLFKHLS